MTWFLEVGPRGCINDETLEPEVTVTVREVSYGMQRGPVSFSAVTCKTDLKVERASTTPPSNIFKTSMAPNTALLQDKSMMKWLLEVRLGDVQLRYQQRWQVSRSIITPSHFPVSLPIPPHQNVREHLLLPGTAITIWVQGGVASGIVYGGVTLLTFFCIQLLWRNDGLPTRTAKNRALLTYVGVMFFLATFILSSNMYTLFFGVRDWCSNQENVMNSLGRLGDVCYVIANWGADALLIWRCIVVYKGSRIPMWAISFLPTLLFLTSIGTGILFLCFPDGKGNILNTRHSGDPENVQSIHACVTLSVNVLVTFMIISRLLLYRHRIVRVLGEKHGSPYTGVITMIVESQAIVLIFGLVLVAELFVEGGGGEGTLLAYQIAAQIQIFAPLLIIFRVAQGKAWSSETYSKVTTITDSERKGASISAIRFESTGDPGRSRGTTVTFGDLP
ncbi:hypothetical protein BDQ17DRAFT_1410468 [Cyathus striatus]|nr:hypothetical protein BDQ17DRAFT_1410468 [Cyathus striatus]